MTRRGTALVVIDMQIAALDLAYRACEVLACVSDLVRRARSAGTSSITSLDSELRRLAVTHLIVAGMQTEYCVDTTCRRAISLGFDVTLVADGHTTSGGLLPAADVIRHHNSVLPRLAHPDHHVTVVAGRDVRFEEDP